MIRRFLSTAALMVALGASVSAFADESAEQIQQYQTMLDQQTQLDTTNAAATDRELAQKWLKEAEVLRANGDDEAASRRLRRVEFTLDLIRAMVAAAEIRVAAETQEAAAYNAPQTVKALQDEVDALKKKRADLQKELQTLQ